MVNIQISTEVPDFFRNVMLKKIGNNKTVLDIYDFTRKKVREDFRLTDEAFNILETTFDLIKLRSKQGKQLRGTLVVELYNHPNNRLKKIIKIGENYYTTVLQNENHQIPVESLKLWDMPFPESAEKYYLNLVDGIILSTDFRELNKVAMSSLTLAISDNFNLYGLINYFSDNRFYDEYNHYISKIEATTELKLYDEWIKHNIRVIKSLEDDHLPF